MRVYLFVYRKVVGLIPSCDNDSLSLFVFITYGVDHENLGPNMFVRVKNRD